MAVEVLAVEDAAFSCASRFPSSASSVEIRDSIPAVVVGRMNVEEDVEGDVGKDPTDDWGDVGWET